MAGDPLVVGQKFRVRYRLDGQKKDRELVGTYLGWSRFYSKHAFDLRPGAGTTELFGDDIKTAQRVAIGSAHELPRMVD